MTEHHLEPTPETAIDVFSRDTPPVLAVDPGDTVVVRSLDANGYQALSTSTTAATSCRSLRSSG